MLHHFDATITHKSSFICTVDDFLLFPDFCFQISMFLKFGHTFKNLQEVQEEEERCWDYNPHMNECLLTLPK